MKSFKCGIIFIVLSIAVFSCQNVLAFSDGHRTAANKLLDTMDMNTLLSGSIEAMLQLQIKQNPTLQPFEKTMRTFFKKYMSGESLREEFILIYMETFTEKELDEINEFYGTPTGKKTLKETPALMAKGAKIGEQRIQQNLPELKKMIQEEAKRIQAMQQKSE